MSSDTGVSVAWHTWSGIFLLFSNIRDNYRLTIKTPHVFQFVSRVQLIRQ